ncbi:MAG: phage integrase SAM-like domain-containing protein [Bacteroidota bacterium]
MAKVRFYLEKRKDKEGNLIVHNVPILLNYSFNGNRLVYFTGERIDAKNAYSSKDPNQWTGELKLPIKSSAPDSSTINTNLETLDLKVRTIASNAKALGEELTCVILKAKLDTQYKRKARELAEKKLGVAMALNEYMTWVEKYRANGTYKKFSSTKMHLTSHFGQKKFESLKFEDVNPAMLELFREYLISKKFLNNTVVKYTSALRTFLLWCKHDDRKYYTGSIQAKGKENDIDVIFITMNELKRLINTPMPTETFDRVRDVYVFGCLTAMRYADIVKLKKSDVKGNCIQFYIGKGSKTVLHTVPLNDYAKTLLFKYNHFEGDKALPAISNQKQNEYIKQVMDIAGINEMVSIAKKGGDGKVYIEQHKKSDLITCHTSRKSFITMAMTSDMRETVIKSISGHSKNSKSFSKYYTIVDELKSQEMNRVFGDLTLHEK